MLLYGGRCRVNPDFTEETMTLSHIGLLLSSNVTDGQYGRVSLHSVHWVSRNVALKVSVNPAREDSPFLDNLLKHFPIHDIDI